MRSMHLLFHQTGKGPSIIYVSMKGYLVGQQNANLVDRAYELNMLTRELSWSKIDKNMLT